MKLKSQWIKLKTISSKSKFLLLTLFSFLFFQTLTAQNTTVSGTVWNDVDGSANGTFSNIQTGAETGTNGNGVMRVYVVRQSTNLVLATSSVAANGTYTSTTFTGGVACYLVLDTINRAIGFNYSGASVIDELEIPVTWAATSPIMTPDFTPTNNTAVTGRDWGVQKDVVAALQNTCANFDSLFTWYFRGALTNLTVGTTIVENSGNSAKIPFLKLTARYSTSSTHSFGDEVARIYAPATYNTPGNGGVYPVPNTAPQNYNFANRHLEIGGDFAATRTGSSTDYADSILVTVALKNTNGLPMPMQKISTSILDFDTWEAIKVVGFRNGQAVRVKVYSGTSVTDDNLNEMRAFYNPSNSAWVYGVATGYASTDACAAYCDYNQSAHAFFEFDSPVDSMTFVRLKEPLGLRNLSSSSVGSNEITSFRYCPIVISGNVWNDVNGDGIISGGETNILSTGMWVNMVDEYGRILATAQVLNDGTYSFGNLPQLATTTAMKLQLSATQGTIGAVPPATGSPTGYLPISENPNGTPETGAGANSEMLLPLTLGANQPNYNFGAQRPPQSAVSTQSTTGNPGGFNSYSVTVGAFQSSTGVTPPPNTQDFDGGTVTNIRITSFPTNANSITINGTVYTNGGTCPPATTCVAWPVGGVTTAYTNGTGPTQAITVDPIEGNVDVVISFAAIDNANREDPTPGSVTIPFRTISVTGTVFNDANGSLTQNGTEAVINGTNTGGGLTTGQVVYANLVAANGKVIATVPVQSDGTYTFPNVPQSATGLTVQLSTVQGVVGVDMPATTPPTGWVSTGENVNAANPATQSGTVGIIELTTSTSSITGQNFGIERLPETVSFSTTIAQPPVNSFITLNGGVNPPVFQGSDPEDQPTTATLSTKSIAITSLPTNGNELWYNNVQITLGADAINPPSLTNPFIIPVFNPSLIQIKATGIGSTSTSFTYAYVDAAGKLDISPATYTLNWAIALPVKLESLSLSSVNCNSVAVNWKVATADQFSHFEIERSNNGLNFETMARLNYSSQQNIYNFSENNLQKGSYQYRLKMVDLNGSFTFSKILYLNSDCNNKIVQIYPNPIADYVTIQGLKGGETIEMFGMNGAPILTKTATGYLNQLSTDRIPAGTYLIRITDKHKQVSNFKVVKQ